MADKIIDIQDEELVKLLDWFDTSLEALQDSRKRAMKDRDFYDGNQWTDDQIAELNKRGQPIVTTNHIAPKVNYILGEQITARVDPAAWPVTPAHDEAADALTAAMRSVTDSNDSDIQQSLSFKEFLIEGCGAMLVSQVLEASQKTVKIPLIRIPWNRFAWDHRSQELDFSDARWLAAVAWYDLEDAKAEYPGNDEIFDDAVNSGNSDTDNPFEDWPQRWAEKDAKRVRVCQMFYKKGKDWYEAHFTKHSLGWLRKPALVKLCDDDKQTQCPIIAASAYVAQTKSNKPPERYGIVRGMISPQEEINKRRSKAMHYLNVSQIIAEQGALAMSKEAALEEVAKPDGYIEANSGALQSKKFEIRSNLELAQSQFQLLQEAKSEIDNIGPQAPLIGTDDRVQTGRSLQVRGEAGEKQLKPVFDSHRHWMRRIFRAIAWQIKRYWPKEMWIRVTDDSKREGYRFVALNRRVTRAERLRELLRDKVPMDRAITMVDLQPVIAEELVQQSNALAQQQVQQGAKAIQMRTGKPPPPEALMPLMQQMANEALMGAPIMQEEITQNHVGDIPIDIKIDVSPDSLIMAHEEFEKLAELAGTGQVQIPTEILIRASQLRNKRELLAVLNPPPDPMAQQMAQLQLAMQQAEVEKTQAQTTELEAKAAEHQANVQFKLGPQASKTQGQAMEAAAKAGNLTIPEKGQGE